MPRGLIAWAVLLIAAASAPAADLAKGTPDLKSAGPMAFGPDGLLFVGDPIGGAVYAIDTGDRVREPIGTKFYAPDIDKTIAAIFEGNRPLFRFNDLAINPASGKAYLSFDRGNIRDCTPAIVRVDSTGKAELVSLRDIPFAKAALPNPAPTTLPIPGRNLFGFSVNDLALIDGRIYVAGLTGKEALSRVISMPYPFPERVEEGTIVEFYFCGQNSFKKTQPILAFAPCRLEGEPHLLAAYLQSPVVKIPISALKPGEQIRVPTIADLGNRNNPYDMLVYRKDGREFLLVATRLNTMKIALDWLADAPPIETPFVGPGKLPLEKIDSLKGLYLLERIDEDHALVLGQKSGGFDLFAIPLP